MFHKLINFNCCESPCLASCLAGWQPRDRSPSLDRTPCSRTEPAAPPKEAHWPTNRDRWREMVGLLPHLSVHDWHRFPAFAESLPNGLNTDKIKQTE